MLFPSIYDNPCLTAEEWWTFHWRQYCKNCLGSLIISFVVGAGITGSPYRYWFSDVITSAERNQLFIWIPLVGYGLAFALSQLIYWVACWGEERIQPTGINRFRRIAFSINFWIARVLPFLVLLPIAARAHSLQQRMAESFFQVIKCN